MKRGEIRWYRFARPDKKRPVVILTRDSIIPYLDQVTVAPITSVIRDIPTEVLLGQAHGMQKDCAINCDNLQTISKAQLGARIGQLPKDKLRELSRAVTFALHLND